MKALQRQRVRGSIRGNQRFLKGEHRGMKKKSTVRDLAFMAICVALSLVAKRIISPVTNTLTDFCRIPGGSAATGFSLAFLIIGKQISPIPFAATMMSFVQAMLALALGFSGYQGALAIVSYVVPGLIIDGLALVMKGRHPLFCFTAGILSSLASAVISNLLIFHLVGISLLLWLLLAALSGALGGLIAQLVSARLLKAIGGNGHQGTVTQTDGEKGN